MPGLVSAALLAAACSSPSASTASATASAVVAVTATSTATAAAVSPATTVAPSLTVAPYINTTYKFSVLLPAPYRSSTRLSLASTGGRPAAQDAFTARTDADEATVSGTGCQTACPIWNYVAVVQIYTGAASQTPRQFYTALGGAAGETVEDTTIDSRQAVKVTNGATYPLQYLIKEGDRVFRIAEQMYPPDMPVPAGASKSKLDQILASFRFMP